MQTSWRIPLVYGAGALGVAATGFVTSSWLLYFYVPPDGVARFPAGWYGLATLASYAFSMILIPWIGYISDRTQTRWGRRYPFLALSALPATLFFLMLWMPPAAAESPHNFFHLLFFLIAFKAATGFYQVPYQALLTDLADSDTLRVRLSAWQSACMLLGFLLGGVAGLAIERGGYRQMALIYAVIMLVTHFLPLLAGRPQNYPIPCEKPAFGKSLRVTLSNRVFLLFTTVWTLSVMASSLVQSSIPYLATEVCEMSEGDTVYFFIPAVLASLICYPLITHLARRFGKWRVYAGALLASALVYPATMLLGRWLLLPLPLQCASWAVLQAAAVSGTLVLSVAFVAEVTVYDQQATGERREGMYFAIAKVFEQLLTGLASLLLPLLLLLGRSRLDAHGPLGVRLAGVIGGILVLVAFFCFLKYPYRSN
ncbi:MAG: MFS transporter [Chloroflexota bacterium]